MIRTLIETGTEEEMTESRDVLSDLNPGLIYIVMGPTEATILDTSGTCGLWLINPNK